MERIRLLLADDHTLIRAGITALLEKIERVEVVGQAEDGRLALHLIEELAPDVVLLDLQMPGVNGFDVLHDAAEKFPTVRIIVLSIYDNEEYALRAIGAGATGYLPKSAASAELEIAINHVVRGEKYISPTITKTSSRDPDRPTTSHEDDDAIQDLTPRQREILILIAEGCSTKVIANTLQISVKTVETHRTMLMDRLGIHDLAGLVKFAVRSGIIKLDS